MRIRRGNRNRLLRWATLTGALSLAVLLAPTAARADHDSDSDSDSDSDRRGRYARHGGYGYDYDHDYDRFDRHRGKRHHGKRADRFRGHRGHRGRWDHGAHDRAFVIPRKIRHHDLHRFRPYYRGRDYYRPHRHHHTVYLFPVYTDYGLRYQPSFYCEGSLYFDHPRRHRHGGFSYCGRRGCFSIGF